MLKEFWILYFSKKFHYEAVDIEDRDRGINMALLLRFLIK